MKSAQEILKITREDTQKREGELSKAVESRVNVFTEMLAAELCTAKQITDEQMEEMFICPDMAVRMLRDLGFIANYWHGYESGHLWWKKKFSGYWSIEVPFEEM